MFDIRGRLILLLVSTAVFSSGQQPPPPDCEPITYFGVRGCEPSAAGTCPRGYHLQAVNPPNPAMKAPSRQICVADSNPSRTARTPEATVEEFYKWYVHMLRENRDPITQEESTLKQYVASALVERIKKQINSAEGLEADYFTKAQDYFDDWETNVSAAEARISDGTASTTVTLGANDKSKYKLHVVLIKEGDVWKISRVNRSVVIKKLHPTAFLVYPEAQRGVPIPL